MSGASLSPRAQRYLAKVPRGSAVPVERVAEALREIDAPVFDVWLDFHARYAGYVESLGNDSAVWGLAHTDSYWQNPMAASAKRYDTGWRVVCAEAHPSYEYWLHENGEFSSCGGGGRCESFEVKLERDGVVYETFTEGRSWTLDFALLEAARTTEKLCRLVGAQVIPEASDKYVTTWRAPDIIVFAHHNVSPRSSPGDVYVAKEALGNLLAALARR